MITNYLYQIIISIFFISFYACHNNTVNDINKPQEPQKASLPHPPSNHWLYHHKDKLLDYDAKNNIYQLKVLRQIKSECSAHQKRNLLFMLDMLDNDIENFNKKYAKMIDSHEYEKMMDNTVCVQRHLGAAELNQI